MGLHGEQDETQRVGRFVLPHRGGTQVEVGKPICVGGDRPWLCAVKLVGRKNGPDGADAPDDADLVEGQADVTQTLLVRTGRGASPEEAQRDAIAQLTLVYGSPVSPPPEPIILPKPSEPPPPVHDARPAPAPAPKRSWLARIFRRKA
jgi:hypothetical protein